MASAGQQPDGRPFGLLVRTVGCLGMAVVGCVLVAAALVIWFFYSWQHTAQSRDHDSYAAVAASADQLRTRLESADADGSLTDREITEALQHRSLRSVVRDEARTVLVVQVAAYDGSRCYSYTALPTGTVTNRALKACPSPAPSPLTSVKAPVKGRQ